MTVVDSLPHGQWAEEEGPARVGGGETMRREIRFGNEICISSLILRSATDLRGECLMENLHDRIKDGITCAYKFFPNSLNLWRTALLARSSKLERKMSHRTFLTYRKNARSDGAISIVEKKGGKELICSLRRRDGVSQRGLRKGLKSRHVPLDRSAQPRSSSHEEG